MKKTYIGDSVYAEFNGYGIVLTTENGNGASNRIILEPQIWQSLKEWVDRLEKSLTAGASHE